MATRELWYADTFLLTNDAVRDIAYESSIYATPGRRGSDIDIAQRHGSIWRPKQYESGGFTINTWVYSEAGQRAALDLYRETMRVISRQDGLVKFERVWDTSPTRHYQCFGELVTSVAPGPMTVRGYRFAFEIRVPGAFWESASPVTHLTVPSATLPQTLSLDNHADSNAPMDDFRYIVTGPITNPGVKLIRTGQTVAEEWVYYGSVGAEQTLTVDAGTWAVTGTGGLAIDQSKLDYTGERYLTVHPHRPGETAPQVQLTGSGGASTTRLSVTGRSKVLA